MHRCHRSQGHSQICLVTQMCCPWISISATITSIIVISWEERKENKVCFPNNYPSTDVTKLFTNVTSLSQSSSEWLFLPVTHDHDGAVDMGEVAVLDCMLGMLQYPPTSLTVFLTININSQHLPLLFYFMDKMWANSDPVRSSKFKHFLRNFFCILIQFWFITHNQNKRESIQIPFYSTS